MKEIFEKMNSTFFDVLNHLPITGEILDINKRYIKNIVIDNGNKREVIIPHRDPIVAHANMVLWNITILDEKDNILSKLENLDFSENSK